MKTIKVKIPILTAGRLKTGEQITEEILQDLAGSYDPEISEAAISLPDNPEAMAYIKKLSLREMDGRTWLVVDSISVLEQHAEKFETLDSSAIDRVLITSPEKTLVWKEPARGKYYLRSVHLSPKSAKKFEFESNPSFAFALADSEQDLNFSKRQAQRDRVRAQKREERINVDKEIYHTCEEQGLDESNPDDLEKAMIASGNVSFQPPATTIEDQREKVRSWREERLDRGLQQVRAIHEASVELGLDPESAEAQEGRGYRLAVFRRPDLFK